MKGSVYEYNVFIANNALVLMKAKETINWMRKTGIYIDGCFHSTDCMIGLLTPAVL